MANTSLVKQVDVSVLDNYTNEEKEVLRTQICKDANDSEIKLFLIICKDAGLNPMAKQIYCIKRAGKMTIQTSIDGFRSMAARTNELAGIDEPVYDSEDQVHPNKATVTVYRLVNGQRFAFTASARWSEYRQENGPMWQRMPYLMLGKCAESLALRKAFPQQLSGIYTKEEMAQAEGDGVDVVDASPAAPKEFIPVTPVADSNKATPDQLDEIESIIKANNWDWGTVNAGIKKTFGQCVELLSSTHAVVVIASLKDKAERQRANEKTIGAELTKKPA